MSDRSGLLVRDHFLPAHLRDALFARVTACEAEFVWGNTRGGPSAQRHALVLDSARLGELESAFLGLLCAEIEAQAEVFDIDASTLQSIQLIVTASSSGCYYRPHLDERDAGAEGARKISAVWFLHRHPPAFRGGELRVYSPEIDGATPAAWTEDDITVVEALDNRLVLFHSATLHEVSEVTMEPGQGFEGCRFSLVAWAR
ncbi:MAG: 2OG-Fe(II) oxygenase [Acidimicrobiales bacterium]|nr:2OG-Fe(II) oxygenase [Acidimicrobiales bacterium]